MFARVCEEGTLYFAWQIYNTSLEDNPLTTAIKLDDVEARKQERSKSKMAVTLAAQRLISATHRDSDFEVVKALIVELEKAYDDFCVISEEYELLVSDEKFTEHRVVNGDDLITYNANVKQTYEEARNVYGIIKAENEKSKQNLAMAPVVF